MKEILEYILKNILDEKDSFRVEEEEDNGFIVFKIFVPSEIIGKVIGKGGKTINSIKSILKVVAIKEQKRVEVEVAEEVKAN